MKEKILSALRVQREGFISGSVLSEQFNCSRMAIWKHIEELREQGYRIESQHRKGYRLITEIDPIDPQEWKQVLRTRVIGQEVVYYPVVDSTQIIAHQLARDGAVDGTCVVADRQTGGKGRLGRKWHAVAGLGLWVSFILRPSLPIESVSQITLVVATAVAKTLSARGYNPEIKWPNDILINGKKVCGILTELHGDVDRVDYIIIGIGINVDHRFEDFAPEIVDRATSLYLENEQITTKRSDLFAELCLTLESVYMIYLNHGFAPIQSIWEAYSISAQQKVVVRTYHESYVGTLIGITEKGTLIVMNEQGEQKEIISADIELYTK